MDLDLPGMNGIEATRRLKALCPAVTVVVLTVFEDPGTILEAIGAGADGYLVKQTSAGDLLAQLRAAAAGGSPLTPRVARTILDLVRDSHTPRAPVKDLRLSDREQAVLHALVEGLSYKQAAAS